MMVAAQKPQEPTLWYEISEWHGTITPRKVMNMGAKMVTLAPFSDGKQHRFEHKGKFYRSWVDARDALARLLAEDAERWQKHVAEIDAKLKAVLVLKEPK